MGDNDKQHKKIDMSDVQFSGNINPELFNEVAENKAKKLADAGRNKNTPHQLRKIYDELLDWCQKVEHNPDKFDDYLPLIQMINAKVAYVKGRDHVDDNFHHFINHCLKQIKDKQSLQYFKLFFEAMLGFHKVHK